VEEAHYCVYCSTKCRPTIQWINRNHSTHVENSAVTST